MEKVTLRRPIGSTKVGDIIDNIGMVEDVFAQGGSDIRVVRQGYFGDVQVEQIAAIENEIIIKRGSTIAESMTENVEMNAIEDESLDEVTEAETGIVLKGKARKKEKLRIAREKASKELLDQSPIVDNEKQLLRG